MRTCIKVSLADAVGDQSYYSLNSDNPDILNPILSSGAESKFKLAKNTSSIAGNGFTCISDGDTLSFSYSSNRDVNNYKGFALTVIFDRAKDDFPFDSDDIADYIGEPDWIDTGLNSTELTSGLASPQKWLKVNSGLSFEKDGKDAHKLIAHIVDSLLQAIKNNSRAKIGLFAADSKDLKNKQKILILALKCLPAKIQSKVSFNMNSNADIDRFDIFCTVYDKGRFKDKEHTDAEQLDGTFKNAFAEYIASAECNPRGGLEDIDSIDELNNRAGYKTLRDRCEKGLPYEREKLKEHIGSYESCEKYDTDNFIRNAFKKVIYNLTFTSNYFFYCTSGCILWDDLYNSRLKKYLNIDADGSEITFKQLCGGNNAFGKAECEKILDRLYGEAGADAALEYFNFLHNHSENLYGEVQEQIEKFLYGNIDNYSGNIQKIFRMHLNSKTPEYVRGYAVKCCKDGFNKFFKEFFKSYCDTVTENMDMCGYLKNNKLSYEWLINFDLLEGSDSAITREKYIEFLLQQENSKDIGDTTKNLIKDVLYNRYDRSPRLQEAVSVYFDTLKSQSEDDFIEYICKLKAFDKNEFIASYIKKTFNTASANIAICEKFKGKNKPYIWIINFDFLYGECGEALKYIKFLRNELDNGQDGGEIKRKLFVNADPSSVLGRAYILYFKELAQSDGLFDFIRQFGDIGLNGCVLAYLNGEYTSLNEKIELCKTLNEKNIIVSRVDGLFKVTDFKSVRDFELLNAFYEIKPSNSKSFEQKAMSLYFQQLFNVYLKNRGYFDENPGAFLKEERIKVDDFDILLTQLKFLEKDYENFKSKLRTVTTKIKDQKSIEEFEAVKRSLLEALDNYDREMPDENGGNDSESSGDLQKCRKSWNTKRLKERKSDETGTKNSNGIAPKIVAGVTAAVNCVLIVFAFLVCNLILVPNFGVWLNPDLTESISFFEVIIVALLFVELAVQVFLMPSDKNKKWTAKDLVVSLAIMPSLICLYFIVIFGFNLLY